MFGTLQKSTLKSTQIVPRNIYQFIASYTVFAIFTMHVRCSGVMLSLKDYCSQQAEKPHWQQLLPSPRKKKAVDFCLSKSV